MSFQGEVGNHTEGERTQRLGLLSSLIHARQLELSAGGSDTRGER